MLLLHYYGNYFGCAFSSDGFYDFRQSESRCCFQRTASSQSDDVQDYINDIAKAQSKLGLTPVSPLKLVTCGRTLGSGSSLSPRAALASSDGGVNLRVPVLDRNLLTSARDLRPGSARTTRLLWKPLGDRGDFLPASGRVRHCGRRIATAR